MRTVTLAARRVTVIPNVNDEPDKTATLDLDLDSGWDLGDEDDDAGDVIAVARRPRAAELGRERAERA